MNSKIHRQTLDRFKQLRVVWTAFATHRLKPLGVVPNQSLFLRTLRLMEPCSLADISASTHIDPAAVVRLADSLTVKGWIVRQEHPTDRRRWRVCLSPGGRKMALKFNAIHDDILGELLSPLTGDELARFNDILEKLWVPHNPVKTGEPKKQPKRKKP